MSIFFKNSLAFALVNGRNRESTLRHAAGSLIAGGVYARLTNKEEYLPAELRFKETYLFSLESEIGCLSQQRRLGGRVGARRSGSGYSAKAPPILRTVVAKVGRPSGTDSSWFYPLG